MKPATDSKSQSNFPAPQVGRTWLFVLGMIMLILIPLLVLLPDHTRTLTAIFIGALMTSLPQKGVATPRR